MLNRIRKNKTAILLFTALAIWVTALFAQNVIRPGPYGVLFRVSTATDTATLTTAQVAPGLLIGTPTGAATYTTPTGTNWCAAWPSVAIQAPGTNTSFGYDLWVRNTSGGANTITLAAGTGVTLATGNTNTVAQNHTRIFKIAFNNCSSTHTVTVYAGPDSAH